MMDLWDEVIHQIENDLEDRDTTALYEMLQRVPKDVLIAYLPEECEFIVSENQGLTSAVVDHIMYITIRERAK